MTLTNLQDIHEGERGRQDYGDLTSLKESIKQYGILVPLLLDDANNLVDGGRRYRASVEILGDLVMQAAMSGTLDQAAYDRFSLVPTSTVGSIDEETLRTYELEANLHREDLKWYEKDKMIANLHHLRLEKYGQSSGANAGWSMEKTAALVGDSKSSIDRSLVMAGMLEQVPELQNCKSRSDAEKLVNRMAEAAVAREIVRRASEKLVNENDSISPKERIALHARDNYIIGDTFDLIQREPNFHYDFIEVDPPYAIALDKDRKDAQDQNLISNYNEMDHSNYIHRMTGLAHQCYRVMKQGWGIWWFGIEWYEPVFNLLIDAGFDVDLIPAIWTKPQGQTNNPEVTLGRCYETFFIFRKSTPILYRRGRLNNFAYHSPTDRFHPTPKAVELMEDILSIFCLPGANLLVPFAGSGATFRAAYKLNLLPRGYDMNPAYKDVFIQRAVADCESEGA